MNRRHPQLALTIEDPTQVGQARRAAAVLAAELVLDEVRAARVGIIVTELATNIVKHAGKGELLLRPLDEGGDGGIEVLALDRGPGMPDVSRCFGDGFSTAGSPGTGLGAVVRQADLHDVYSAPGKGTVLMARVSGSKHIPQSDLDIGAICLPIRGELMPGDAWDVELAGGRIKVIVVDGLGHGPLAAEAADAAVAIFREHSGATPEEILDVAHDALRSTRGAAMAVAALQLDRQALHFCGVGNIGAAIVAGDESRSLVSQNGTIGAEARRRQSFTYPWPAGGVLVMYSDGLMSRWSVSAYPALINRHPAVIAAVLYRDFSRMRDDVTVVVARERRH